MPDAVTLTIGSAETLDHYIREHGRLCAEASELEATAKASRIAADSARSLACSASTRVQEALDARSRALSGSQEERDAL